MTLVPKTWQRRALLAAAVLAAAGGAKLLLFPAPASPAYLTAPVTRADLEDSVLASGAVKALKQVSVGAQVSGEVKSLKVSLGQQVKKGELVAEIDPRSQQNTLLDAEAALASKQAQLRVKQAALTKADLDARRQTSMLAEEATARENVDSARASLATARAEVAQLQAEIEQARITLNTARLNLGYTKIVAPIDGVVVAVPVEEGQTVNASQSAPTIVKIAQLDTVTVKAEISEGDVTRVKPGLPVYFTILGAPDRRYRATLRAIDPGPQSLSDAADSSTSSSSSSSSSSNSSSSSSSAIYYYGLFDVPNPDHQLRISMTTQVSIVLAEARNVLTIPATALGERGQDGVYTVTVLDQDGRPSPRRVKIGLNNNVSAQVLSGLKQGERVVVGQASASTASSSERRGPPMGL
ncbi:efflux RND transporter periplasmic adaptor subunit [Pseudogulbenkiania ferrooxidans]|uniref:Efflux transporter, RND family, MFP subunit n=1 Tax=Pseudogulbenkiania ferrooxidans 2002 TaxID=279714 RepID=B9YZ54_9NEIS|nr:efflux RND transporter periplasmic adaptor subunit [Pseudogulbenkiania ferrooxidans]EEG10407.1 efflux transporter, RND family, MFP subunit [Pseudogulbenkiania ferrooxidans 2002]